jgi:hypothetical protein
MPNISLARINRTRAPSKLKSCLKISRCHTPNSCPRQAAAVAGLIPEPFRNKTNFGNSTLQIAAEAED